MSLSSNVHKHQCDGCYHVWEHDAEKVDKEKNDEAHECPMCGRAQRVRYHGYRLGIVSQAGYKPEFVVPQESLSPEQNTSVPRSSWSSGRRFI